ncbi:RICIN domain-containing protein [Nonomuraea insulae]|uniref:RICIN domain-containing protein n=1 Tax=Nonomuraea insulae TaxID=1616787 RepID=A0ABW1D9M5_9ACTN
MHKSVKACVRAATAAALLTLLTSLVTPAPAGGRLELTSSGTNTALATTRIRNQNSGLCLAARAGTGERPAIQTTCDYQVGRDWPDQHWTLEKVVSGTDIYRLRNQELNLCLAARGSGEVQAIATTCDRDTGHEWRDQHWIYLYDGATGHRWQNRASLNCLAARGTGQSPAITTTCNADWVDQHWNLQ